MSPQLEPVVHVSPESPDDVLHLGPVVLWQEAVARVEVVHLQRELVITRPLGPQQPQAGLGDLGHRGGQGLAGGGALGGVTRQLTRPGPGTNVYLAKRKMKK